MTFAYQWKRDGTPIEGATGATYTTIPTDIGSYMSVTITGQKAGYSTASPTSAPFGPIVGTDDPIGDADVAAPVLESWSVTPKTLDISGGSGTVKVSVRLTDATGSKAPVVSMSHDESGQSHGFGSMTLVSGDARDGVWERTITVPQGAATGPWDVTLYPLDDTLGNSAGGFRTLDSVEVTGPVSDTAAPVLESWSVTPKTLDISGGSGTVNVSVRLTDATGSKAPVVSMSHDESGQSHGFGSMTLVSGDARDGVWERTITVPQAAATGPWDVTLYPLDDTLGNSAGGFRTLDSVEVTGPVSDTAAPVLESWSVTPKTLDISGGSGTVKVSVRLTDDTGSKAPVVSMSHDESGQSHGFGSMTLVSGDARDGVWERTITIPQAAAIGKWEVSLFPLDDTLGNSTDGFRILDEVVVTSRVTVVPEPVVFADEDGTANDTFTVPEVKGVDYLAGNEVVTAGTHPGAGTVTVTAKPQTNYVLKDGAVAEWSHVFKATPYVVVPEPVVFADENGTAKDTFTVPETKGVDYYLGDEKVEAGSHSGAGTVTVTAKPQADYVLKDGAVAEWSHVFKATPYVVVPEPVVFADEDGTAKDTFTVPETKGVDYYLGDEKVEAGTHSGAGKVAVTAKPQTNYVLKDGAVAEWSHVFKVTPYVVVPEPVVFADEDGPAKDTYTVPGTKGVDYLVDDEVVAAGTHPGTGTVTVTARAQTDYVLKDGATAEWSHVFKATPYVVVPEPVVFTDLDGTAKDTFTVPEVKGVDYLVGNEVVAAGTHPATGTVTVTAKPQTDYVLKDGTAAEWSHVFKATPYVVVPEPVVFLDEDGTANDSYTVPDVAGVDYLANGDKMTPGTHQGSGIVTVTAQPKTDYVFAAGVVAEWSHEFKVTPYVVVPKAVVFTDEVGSKRDTFTIPEAKGVTYIVAGEPVAAGTYPGTGAVTVSAEAMTDYVLAENAVAEWTHVFAVQPQQVSPLPVIFTDWDGTADDAYMIPSSEGVEYLVDGTLVAPGTYPASGKVTVTARALEGFGWVQAAITEWSHEFAATPYRTVPKPVVFSDEDGTAKDTFTVPAAEGVEYRINDAKVSAGTYPGSGVVTVTATAQKDYLLEAGATAAWSHTFLETPYTVVPKPVTFDDGGATYTLPSVKGVRYAVNGLVKEAGTHTAPTGTVTVEAKAETDYVLTGTVSWSHTFQPKASPSIIEGDMVAIDSQGRLWNYGKSGSKRVMIGRSGWSTMDEIHSVDWNADGYVDIIAKTKSGQLYFYKASRTGGFSRLTLGGSGWTPFDLSVTKWKSGDKYPSIIAKDTKAGRLFVYGNPSGYRLSARYTLGSSGWSKYTLVAMDWDKDGRKDLVARTSAGQLKLYRGNGSGKFVSESRATIGSSGWNAMSHLVAANGFGGAGTTGMFARDTSGRLWYYQADKSRWIPRISIGSGWSSYNIAGQ